MNNNMWTIKALDDNEPLPPAGVIWTATGNPAVDEIVSLQEINFHGTKFLLYARDKGDHLELVIEADEDCVSFLAPVVAGGKTNIIALMFKNNISKE